MSDGPEALRHKGMGVFGLVPVRAYGSPARGGVSDKYGTSPQPLGESFPAAARVGPPTPTERHSCVGRAPFGVDGRGPIGFLGAGKGRIRSQAGTWQD
ncbi:hypothetical protein GCM10010442_29190 [Kitasatospora kifunensis]